VTFVDSGAWFASLIPWDQHHAEAITWMTGRRVMFLTTDFVIDETLSLLVRWKQRDRAIQLGRDLFEGKLAHVHFLSEEEIREAWQIFQKFRDKDWSFTDCTSKVVMERLGITEAFSFDQHFRQFGTVSVVP
jgi:uncharacterized protein